MLIKDLELGKYPGLSRWVYSNHKGPYKRQTGGSERGGDGSVMMRATTAVRQL